MKATGASWYFDKHGRESTSKHSKYMLTLDAERWEYIVSTRDNEYDWEWTEAFASPIKDVALMWVRLQ